MGKPPIARSQSPFLHKLSGIEPGTIGILNDENALTFELERMVDALRARGRRAVLADAGDLHYRGGRLYLDDAPLSLTYNKFRVSTPRSPNHCWRDGFEQRYQAFLAAQRDAAVVSVNNLGGLTVAEDKSLLALFFEPEIVAGLSDAQRTLIGRHLLWTARLQEGTTLCHGRQIDLLPYVLAHREQFVIKPANEGRGFGVVVGAYASERQWRQVCMVDPDLPRVVQEATDVVSLPVVHQDAGQIAVTPMFLTLGLALIDGRYSGLVSRVSPDPVTNVARRGYGQAVFCEK